MSALILHVLAASEDCETHVLRACPHGSISDVRFKKKKKKLQIDGNAQALFKCVCVFFLLPELQATEFDLYLLPFRNGIYKAAIKQQAHIAVPAAS